MSGRNPILCAIDTPDSGAARRLAAAIGPFVGGIKLGLEFFTANGPDAVRQIAGAAPLFLDLKLHDIPNTVAGAVRAAALLEPALLTVHCAGGTAMMKAAADAAASGAGRMKIIGVTVLTSLNDADLASVGQNGPTLDQVRRLAALAKAAGLDGVVCSPHEVAALRRDCGHGFLLVVPGIRPPRIEQANAARQDDQKRVMTPREALDAGADYLVIGRPITAVPDAAAACRAILAEIAP
jgi:orotidine-5'-phosphate decarboxylase